MLKLGNISSCRYIFLLLGVICLGTVPGEAGTPEDIFILSDLDSGRVEVRLWFEEGVEPEESVHISLENPKGEIQEIADLPVQASPIEDFSYFHFQVDPVYSWSPQNPNLYEINIKWDETQPTTKRYGIRKLESRDARFYVNNQPFYVRACGHEIEPFLDTLDAEGIRKRLTQARRYGFNTVRHHSHCPSEEYLSIADEVGIFIQMEIHGKIGNDPESERFAESKEAWEEMIQRGRRHPCTFIYSIGNEIYKNDPGLVESQNILYDLAKKMDPSTLVLNRSGSNPFNDPYGRYDLIERPIGEYEHVPWFAREAFELYLEGPRKGRSEEVPIIAHEYPLVASYPNVELAYQYEQTPEWLKITLENARENGLEHLLEQYVKSAEAIQAICRKEMLEEARKFPQLDGYSMLRFTDNMNKVSGVTTDLADPKNVSIEEFLRTNGQTVLLSTFNDRSFEFGDILEATIEISHHGPEPYSAPACLWWLIEGPTVLKEGVFEKISAGPVDVATVGKVRCRIPELADPAELTLQVKLPGTRPSINNDWPIWAFSPDKLSAEKQQKIVLWDPENRLTPITEVYDGFKVENSSRWRITRNRDFELVISYRWQDSFYEYLKEGGGIWILSDKTWPWPEEIGIFGLHITRIDPAEQAPAVFPQLDEPLTKWLTICSNSKVRHGNSGTIISDHPSLEKFPHEGFCSLQFWPMIYRAKSLRLADFPAGTDPIIRTIDNYYRGRSKGYMAELQVGDGLLFISTLNFNQSFPWSVASRALFDQLLQYQLKEERYPSAVISERQLQNMLETYAEELEKNPPAVLDEMKARYTTRWKWLMSPSELLILPVYEAEGVVGEGLGVHWEYAQTQWYYSAQPGETLTWTFKNETSGEFLLTLHLATALKQTALLVQLDEQEPQKVFVESSRGWNNFIEVEAPINNVETGSHQLKVKVLETNAMMEGLAVNIRDAELRAVTKS